MGGRVRLGGGAGVGWGEGDIGGVARWRTEEEGGRWRALRVGTGGGGGGVCGRGREGGHSENAG